MEKLVKKLKSQVGESLGETLIALLISVLGITLLAMMIQTSSNLIKKGNEQFIGYIEKDIALVEQDTNTLNGTVQITSATDATKYYYIDKNTTTAGASAEYNVNYFKNEANNIKVISYKAKWKRLETKKDLH